MFTILPQSVLSKASHLTTSAIYNFFTAYTCLLLSALAAYYFRAAGPYHLTAMDGFWSTVDRNGTGTGQNGSGTGKLACRFAQNGSRFLPFPRTDVAAKTTVFYRSIHLQPFFGKN